MKCNFFKLDRGPSVFKMNNKVLLGNEHQRQIRQNIENEGELNKDSYPNTLWELIKGAIRIVHLRQKKEGE